MSSEHCWFDCSRGRKMILTGTFIESLQCSLDLAWRWLHETGSSDLYCMVRIHPHHAKTWNNTTVSEMKQLLQHCLAVSIGDYGLDYNQNFSYEHLFAFLWTVKLVIELILPLLTHEHETHNDFGKAFEEFDSESLSLIVVHCFNMTRDEAVEYMQRGYDIRFTGKICEHVHGAPLRKVLSSICWGKWWLRLMILSWSFRWDSIVASLQIVLRSQEK